MRPKHARTDRVQNQLVSNLRQLGMVVWVTAPLPTPVLDLAVFWRGQTRIVEVKTPGHEQDFTEGERRSIQQLRAAGVEVIVATCAEDVIAAWDNPDRPDRQARWQIGEQDSIGPINELLADAVELVAIKASYARSKTLRPTLAEIRQKLVDISDAMAQAIEWRTG